MCLKARIISSRNRALSSFAAWAEFACTALDKLQPEFGRPERRAAVMDRDGGMALNDTPPTKKGGVATALSNPNRAGRSGDDAGDDAGAATVRGFRGRRGRFDHAMIEATTPAPTVRPPSRMAKRSFSSIAIGAISVTSIEMLSPGITISVPSGSETTPVTSVVRK